MVREDAAAARARGDAVQCDAKEQQVRVSGRCGAVCCLLRAAYSIALLMCCRCRRCSSRCRTKNKLQSRSAMPHAASKRCNVRAALQLEARVQEQQAQLDEAGRHHQLFVQRARFVARPSAAAALT